MEASDDVTVTVLRLSVESRFKIPHWQNEKEKRTLFMLHRLGVRCVSLYCTGNGSETGVSTEVLNLHQS